MISRPRSRKWIWAAGAAVLLGAVYLLAGYFLAPRLIFKGGNRMRKGFYPETRFS